MSIAVIGAGASGMAAALQAAWHGATVTLFEQNSDVGKKLLVTGNGRCNITNDGVAAEKYTCADTAWMETLIGRFGVGDLLSMLASIGIPVHKTTDGWYYPLSNSAQSVVAAFSSALQLAGVIFCHPARVSSIHINDKGFVIHFFQKNIEMEKDFEQVIVSAGGRAYPSLGSRGALFPVLEHLGHTVLPKRPALAPLMADLGDLQTLEGVRLNVGATLWDGSRKITSTSGNLIFTKWGLNGPAVMDLSHYVSLHGGIELEVSLDFLFYFREEFNQLLKQKRTSPMPLRVFLNAFFAPKVSLVFLENSAVDVDLPLDQADDSVLERLIRQLTEKHLRVKGVRGFEYCQVSAGGVPVSEVDPLTLESCRVKGMYLTGETLDVVGPCGGYNLQFAFSSGALAGRAAAIKEKL